MHRPAKQSSLGQLLQPCCCIILFAKRYRLGAHVTHLQPAAILASVYLPFQGARMLLSQLIGAVARCEAVKAAALAWGIPLPEGRAQQSPIALNALQDSPVHISRHGWARDKLHRYAVSRRRPTGLRRAQRRLCIPAGHILPRGACSDSDISAWKHSLNRQKLSESIS